MSKPTPDVAQGDAGYAPTSPSPTARRESRAMRALLTAEGLYKTYAMGRSRLTVLRGCSLQVADGEFIAVMGKSGSGKSTLLHVLGALDVPEAGQVIFDGQPVFAPPEERRVRPRVLDGFSRYEKHRDALRRTRFGFVFQFYHLLPELNVLENVLLARMVSVPVFGWPAARKAAREAATALLQRVGLQHRLRHRPNELSGGERQRVAIARALVHQPRILLADEPTGNLDAQSGESLLALLEDLHREGQTLIMVTHDPAVARRADRVLRLENGVLV